MDIVTELFVGIGLAMDCSAVSTAGGANTKKAKLTKAALLAALFFGAFQAGMLFLGGMGGEALKGTVSDIDHWIAFGLLAIVGGKMLLEASRKCEREKADLLDSRTLLLLALATSIDALGVGAGVAFANSLLVETAVVVGITTASISFMSVFIGNRFGRSLEGKAEALGGIVLIAIGLNILRNHLLA
jgi:putative Mn2+ efflux pump MntP